MNRQVSPNLVAIVLIAFAVMMVAILPVSIRIVPNASVAQEATATTTTGMDTTLPMHTTHQEPQVLEYTLRTIMGQVPPMAFIGVGGDIDGQINPVLTANVGDTVQIIVINGDPVLHDLKID